jgi:hypothetical protein
MIDESAWSVTSPAEARERREDALDLELRQLRALNTVEEAMARYLTEEATFQIGFAAPPLGGTEAWLEEDLVSFVALRYQEAGWSVEVGDHRLTFTDPATLTA